MKTQKQVYDELEKINKNESFWTKNRNPHYFRSSSDNLLKLIKQVPHASILEVGCSDGAFTKELVKIADHVVGIDVSESEIKRAKKNVRKATFMTSSLEDFNPEGLHSKFDVIICSEVLYYIQDTDKAIFKLQVLGKYLVTSHFIANVPYLSFKSLVWEWRLRIFSTIYQIIEKSWTDKLIVIKTLRKL